MNVAKLIEDLKNDRVSPAECEDAAEFIESLLSQAKQREGQIRELKKAGRELLNWYRYTYRNDPSEHPKHPFVILNNMTHNVEVQGPPKAVPLERPVGRQED